MKTSIGWSWTPHSFSWVEPTSYFILALKKIKAIFQLKRFMRRVEQGELMIYDRMCEGGGWNYGNAAVYDDRLWPYPDITADRVDRAARSARSQRKSVEPSRVDRHGAKYGPGLALGWTLLCLSIYGKTGPS